VAGRDRDEVLARAVLSEVIGGDIELVPDGGEFKACCPFHEEKTASFKVNDAKGFYHCFGCGAHGNALDYLMEQHGLEFREALEQLAKETGVTLTSRGRFGAAGADEKTGEAIVAQYGRWREEHADQVRRRYPAVAELTADQVGELALGWAPAEGAQRGGWEALTDSPALASLFKQWGLTGAHRPAEALIVPTFGVKGDLVGLYAVDGRHRARGYGGAYERPTPLVNPQARAVGHRERRSTPVWVTDDLETWLALTGRGRPAMCLPWPHALQQAEAVMETRLRAWARVAVALAHQTVYLYDHPMLRALLSGFRADQEVRITEARPGRLPRLDQCQGLSEYLLGRSEADARVDLQGGGARLASIARHWLEALPEGLYRFALADRVRQRLEKLPASTADPAPVEHPLGWPEEVRWAVQIMDRYPQLRRALPRGTPGGELVARMCRGGRLEARHKAVLAALSRQHPLPREMQKREDAERWLAQWLGPARKRPENDPMAAAVGPAP